MTEPENLVLQLLREVRADTATKSDIARLENRIADVDGRVTSLSADVASDLMTMEKRLSTMEKRLSEQIVGLRRAVMEYHSSAIGHGVLISEFEDRLRRVEERLDLMSSDAH